MQTMIKLIKQGDYLLIESGLSGKVLIFDHRLTYIWECRGNKNSFHISSKKLHEPLCALSAGKYRMYDVRDEKEFRNSLHLELNYGRGLWQGYLLPEGLPSTKLKKTKVEPSSEVITKTSALSENFYLY